MSNTHKPINDATATLGTIHTEQQQRDAVHLACEPVIAGENLKPGDQIGIINGHAFKAGLHVKALGIVDPFIIQQNGVKVGDQFWLILFPRMITSLRHVWEHPDFKPSVDTPAPSLKEVSEAWMRAWAMEHMSDDNKLDEATAYNNAIRAGHDNHLGPYEDAPIDDEWWNHWEIITGKQGNRGSYMSCSC